MHISRKNETQQISESEMSIQQNTLLKPYTTMKIGGTAKYFTIVKNEQEIVSASNWAKTNNIKMFPIGGGSNTVFSDSNHDFLGILMRNKGILKIYENSEIINLDVQAGEDWDDFVNWTIEHDLRGLECLSEIPGTVGACPIQNIGAYGSEIKDTLTKVRLLDVSTDKVFEVPSSECGFSYRDSVFKQNLGKFIILSVSFSLNKNNGPIEIPQYKDVQLYFLEKQKKKATPKEIRQAIMEIRNQKIPIPDEIPNSGSFFKNPIVLNKIASQILLQYPEMPYSKIDKDHSKLFAGWLIEKCNLKGHDFGTIRIDSKNSLILTNPESKALFADLEFAITKIKEDITKKFNLELEVEPNLIV